MASIYIKIDIGKKSQGCTGFGVCSVTIGAELSALTPRQTPGTLEIDATGRAVITFRDTRRLQGISAIAIDSYVPFELTGCDGTNGTAYALVPGLHEVLNGVVTVPLVSAPLL